MSTQANSPDSVAFGRFEVLPHRRELLADGRPVKLGGRAFDLLLALIEAPGAVLSKDVLMARVWPGRVVDEFNLQAQVSALRGALGADRDLIHTVSGRGYQFTGDIRVPSANAEAAGPPTPPPTVSRPPTNLPQAVSDLIGRDTELREVLDLAATHRLVTLTGGGGIGKTSLGFAVARQLMPQFPDGVWLAELAPLSAPELVPVTVAKALGVELAAGAISAVRVANAVGRKRLLLLLDTCEHVIDAAAAIAEALLQADPEACVLATSLEPLRAEGEQVYSVPPLAVPAEPAVAGDDVMHYGAIRLFVERASAADPHFAAGRGSAATVAAICRRLDGMPLAIELAAARVATLGVTQLAARLDDRFKLLIAGRRTALPRHQTLRAALDWSYGLLTESERLILRRLAVFDGPFRPEAAAAIVSGGDLAAPDVVEGLADLVAKSLVSANFDDRIVPHRLLDTTRAYALEKLAESGEIDGIRRRHAQYYRSWLESVAEDSPAAAYAPKLDNLRAALQWAFGPGGDPSIGVALAEASVPIWFEMSLLSECRGWMEKALAALDSVGPAAKPAMILSCALGYALMFAYGLNDQASAALTRARDLAEQVGDLDYQLRALAGLASIRHRLQDFHGAVSLGRQAEETAKTSSDPVILSMADWILGTSLQLLGEYDEALAYAQKTYARCAAPAIRQAHLARLGRDSFISAGSTIAVIRWTQGLPDQSAAMARRVLADAEAGDHPVSVCLALTWCGCIVPLRMGELDTAERAIARLKQRAQRHGLGGYYANAICFEGQLAARRGDTAGAERLYRDGVRHLRQTQSETFYTMFLRGLAEALMASGHFEEAFAAADEAVRRCEQYNAYWVMPEALRVRGEVTLLWQRDTRAAEELFRRSLSLAHKQGALSWELRAAMSLARLGRNQGLMPEARTILDAVYQRFTEGLATADLRAARLLLGELANIPAA